MHKNILLKYKTNIFLPLFSAIFSDTHRKKEMKNKERPASL